jgi:FkbM family methyltransferase
MKHLFQETIRRFRAGAPIRNRFMFFRFLLRFWGAPRLRPRAGIRFNGLRLDIADEPSFLWQYKEIYVDELYRFPPETQTPLIYDCGANIGVSVCYFKTHYPGAAVKAFEPDAALFKLLKGNIEQNGLMKGVSLFNEAVWIHANGVLFSGDGADGGAVAPEGFPVKSVRLRDRLAGEERVDFLKIDIEGAEVDVLLDCEDVLRNVRRLFIEFHGDKQQPQRLSILLALLERTGFRYAIQSAHPKRSPFVTPAAPGPFDLQLNIFGINPTPPAILPP